MLIFGNSTNFLGFTLGFNVPVNNLSVMLGWKHDFLGINQYYGDHMSHDARKPDNCLCENKGADQLRGNREADQRLCFRYSDSTIPPLLNSKISSFKLLSVTVQVGLC